MRAVGSRTRVALAGLALLLLLGWSAAGPSVGIAAGTGTTVATQQTPESLPLVSVGPDGGEQLWPYTSRHPRYDTATLPINVVVLKNAAYVRYLLSSTTGATWQVSEAGAGNATDVSAADANASTVESGVVLNGTRIEWTTARGSTRYTYLHDPSTERGEWVRETYQLHDGTYLGTRYHIRLYEGGSGADRWTAIQAHREHWDWFRLRHTVDSVDRAQDYVEREFLGGWFLERIVRQRFGNGGAVDADGWVTVVHLRDRGLIAPTAPALAVVLWAATLTPRSAPDGTRTPLDRTRVVRALRARVDDGAIDPRMLALVAVLALLPLAVRLAGIALEGAFPRLSPKVIAGVLYPLLVLGLPVATYAFARSIPAQSASVAAPAALGVGVLLDYAYLGISVLTIDTVVHRAILLVAIGLLAAGASRAASEASPWNPPLAVGLVGWVVGLLIPLLGPS